MTQRANDFLIWRAGTSVNWECTAQEIADETGLARSTVWKTCGRRKWNLARAGYTSRHGIDTIMAHPAMQNGGAT